ncbi:MAG: putative Zn-dependent protease [Candidatus Saganbacteria bacterium]|uniref:Putative Zn-dependent protease n=1 Tax=Candidatus Saganbacteria bacterium TaxID=2575572 RepID=A0A833KZL7_UNCSA|nr:MAG: putative Zn-dependent protease [Candidatus Saganbacteria bacterium]
MFFYNDPTFLLLIPALLLTLYAQFKVKSTFAKYSEINSKSGKTAAEVSRLILDSAGLRTIPIQEVEGDLTDNYDPRDKTLHLSRSVYNSQSVAAIGVAAHEAGHAIQDAKAYAPMALRQNLVPAANLGSQMAIPLFFMGLIFSLPMLMDIGIIAFSLAVAFQAVTLPVEFNASSRAIKVLSNYLAQDEIPMARQVLNAAALTYIAAAAMAVLNLIRLIILRDRRD